MLQGLIYLAECVYIGEPQFNTRNPLAVISGIYVGFLFCHKYLQSISLKLRLNYYFLKQQVCTKYIWYAFLNIYYLCLHRDGYCLLLDTFSLLLECERLLLKNVRNKLFFVQKKTSSFHESIDTYGGGYVNQHK